MKDGGIVMRMHRTGGERLLAACDEELIGRELKIGAARQIISSAFYGSTRVTAEELLENLRAATIANLLGERTVRHALAAGLITDEATSLLDGVPHAEIVSL